MARHIYQPGPKRDLSFERIVDLAPTRIWAAWTEPEHLTVENGGRRSHRATYNAGVGERGQRTCEKCCHICKDGTLLPAITLRERNSLGK